MQITRTPILASGAWNNSSGALDVGGNYASRGGPLAEFDLNLGDRLSLTGHSEIDVPEGKSIFGIQIRFRARKRIVTSGLGGAGLGRSFEGLHIAPSKDGINPIGTPAFLALSLDWTEYTVGLPSHLWDGTWTPEDVNASEFGSLFWYDFPDQETYCDLDWVVIDVFYGNNGDSFTMSTALAALQDVQIGKETTPGTAVACPIKLNKTILEIHSESEFKKYDHAGSKIMGQSHHTREHSKIDLSGGLTYDEIGYVLASLWGKPLTQSLGSGAYQHIFTKRARSLDDPQYYTVQVGDQEDSRQSANVRINALELEFSDDEVSMSGGGIGKAFSTGVTRTAGANEVQTLTASGTGTIKFTFDGATQTSAAISVGSLSASNIATALNSLPTAFTDGFAVSGTGPFVITAQNALAGKNIPMIGWVVASGSPTISIAETTRGGLSIVDCIPVLPGQTSVYLATSMAAISSGQLGDLSSAKVNFGEVAGPRFVVDRAQNKTLKKVVDKRHEMTLEYTVEANAAGMALLADMRGDVAKFARIESVGAQIASGIYYTFRLDMAVDGIGINPFEDDDETYAIGFEHGVKFDETWGGSAQIVIINKVASY